LVVGRVVFRNKRGTRKDPSLDFKHGVEGRCMAKKRTTKPVKAISIKEEKRVEQAMQQLRSLAAEFFDVGVILLSKEIEGKTLFHYCQFGNEFAVKGIVNNYVDNIMEDSNLDWDGEWADDEEDGGNNWKKEEL